MTDLYRKNLIISPASFKVNDRAHKEKTPIKEFSS